MAEVKERDLRSRIALKYGQGRGILLSREDTAALYKILSPVASHAPTEEIPSGDVSVAPEAAKDGGGNNSRVPPPLPTCSACGGEMNPAFVCSKCGLHTGCADSPAPSAPQKVNVLMTLCECEHKRQRHKGTMCTGICLDCDCTEFKAAPATRREILDNLGRAEIHEGTYDQVPSDWEPSAAPEEPTK